MSTKYHERLRKFNRVIINPITRLFAGHLFYSLIFHFGRRSGKQYTTPIVAARKDEFIFIPLPYGTNTDWLLNVQAKGECVVKLKGQCYCSIQPEIVNSSTALLAFPTALQKTFERASIKQFLRLRIK